MTVKTKYTEEAVEILIVEDSPTQAEHLRHVLEQNSYSVTVANNGREALDHLDKHMPTLIITDIVMPEMNGYELCQKIKADEKTKDIPLVLLTSLANSEDVLEGLACGADNFISKPYNEQYLLSNLSNILANRNLRKNDLVRVGVEIRFGGKKRFITADQQQMLSMLISTYEAAVNRNKELTQAQNELEAINERLEEMVEERTAELSATEIRYRRLFEAAKDGILILDADTGEVVDVNPFLSGLLKKTSEQILGRKIWELGFLKDLVANKANFEELRQKEYIRYEDKPLETAEGVEIHVEFISNIYEVNGLKVIQCNIRDITERKRAEAKHKETTALLKMAGDKAKLGGWSVDLTKNICTWSDETAAIHERPAGYAPSLEEGIRYYAPEWREKITKVFTESAQNGIPYDEEMEIITASGKRVWVRSMGEPVKDEAGKIVKLQGAFQDITERKQAEEELQLRLNELQRWHAVTIDREDRLLELKNEVNELLIEAGRPVKYGG